LIRLNSAKEIKGFSLAKFGWALLNEARIWLDLGLAWIFLDGGGAAQARFVISPNRAVG
jgi:hypothetical protein